MTSKTPKEILLEKQLHAKKSFGQNFLISDHHLNVIAKEITALKSSDQNIIFEIGAGLGALTKALLEQNNIVHAIERDRDLIPILKETFKDAIANHKLVLHEANATTFAFDEVTNKPFVLCGNLPYHLTSSLIFKTIELQENLLGSIYMIQAEVANRIASKSGNKVYGLLSVLVQAKFNATVVHEVPRDAFWPAPKVESSVIKLTPKAEQPDLDWPYFVKMVKMAFATRRKTLRNALAKLDNAENKMKEANINPGDRAEQLTVADFIRLAKAKG